MTVELGPPCIYGKRHRAILTFELAFRWAFRWAKVRSKSRLKSKIKVIYWFRWAKDLDQIYDLSKYILTPELSWTLV